MKRITFSILSVTALILVTTVQPSSAFLRLDNEPELRETQGDIFRLNSKSGWVLLNYVNPNTVHFTASGHGTTAELSPHLKDDQIQFALLRLPAESSTRDVFIFWSGPKVDYDEAGRKAFDIPDAQVYLAPSNGAVIVLGKKNFNDKTVLERSKSFVSSNIIY